MNLKKYIINLLSLNIFFIFFQILFSSTFLLYFIFLVWVPNRLLVFLFLVLFELQMKSNYLGNGFLFFRQRNKNSFVFSISIFFFFFSKFKKCTISKKNAFKYFNLSF